MKKNPNSFALPKIEFPITPKEKSIGIWFTQSHSCQRDLILAAKKVKLFSGIHIIASHEDLRPEITSVADIQLVEPKVDRVEWVLLNAQRFNVKLIITGRYGKLYLDKKEKFDALGIRLMSGCSTAESVEQLHNKSLFTQLCKKSNLPVVPATTVKNASEMRDAFKSWAKKGEVCVKPVRGVFASGFWHLDPNTQPFDTFANSQNYKAHPETFMSAYGALEKPPEYLVMPFLSELECSVDMYCKDGVVVQAVARYKQKGDYQTLVLEDPAIDMAIDAAKLFKCDGLVNMQARYNKKGEIFILEINPRPSGGISNTFHSGINIVHAAIFDAFGQKYIPEKPKEAVVRSISQSVAV